MTARLASYDHGSSEFPLVYTTVGELFDATAEKFPDTECVVSVHQGARFTYREFREITDNLAKGLLSLGVRRGDRVGVWSINRWEWIAVQFATAKIGAVLLNVNPAYRTHELQYVLQQSGAATMILMDAFKSSAYKKMLCEICPEIPLSQPGDLHAANLPELRNVVLMDGAEPGTFGLAALIEAGRQRPDDELRAITSGLDPDDEINIQYTSGTTGFPKGVTLTHFNVGNNGRHIGDVMRLTERDRMCVPVPFYHCFGMVLSILACVTHGATVVIPAPVFDPEANLRTVAAEKCTALQGVPTMFIAALNLPTIANYDLHTLRTGIMAGAPCPIDTMREVISKMGMTEFVIAFGQTESSPVTTMTRIEDDLEHRVATVGRVMPMQEIKVIDPVSGETVPRGAQGEICFRGYNVMRRYYKNPEATAETIDAARWLHSGDLGVMNPDGYLKITGRLKEMVIRGGENLYPREIEEFLRRHPRVMDVYVIGVPDAKYGEELMAWVLPKNGDELTAEQLREFAKGKITHHKIPRYFKFVKTAADFPMTVTGKIQKFKMREIAVAELGLEAAAKIKTA